MRGAWSTGISRSASADKFRVSKASSSYDSLNSLSYSSWLLLPETVEPPVRGVGLDLFIPLLIEIILQPVRHGPSVLHGKRAESVFNFSDGARGMTVRRLTPEIKKGSRQV